MKKQTLKQKLEVANKAKERKRFNRDAKNGRIKEPWDDGFDPEKTICAICGNHSTLRKTNTSLEKLKITDLKEEDENPFRFWECNSCLSITGYRNGESIISEYYEATS